ncbi:MAG: hypothetical protein N3A69_12045 [Leptospiraceae bacterium]|nr:hypothetical protein [Leptospiraceae bacterium]
MPFEERIIVYFPYVGENPRKAGSANPFSRWISGVYPSKIVNVKELVKKSSEFSKFTILLEPRMK